MGKIAMQGPVQVGTFVGREVYCSGHTVCQVLQVRLLLWHPERSTRHWAGSLHWYGVHGWFRNIRRDQTQRLAKHLQFLLLALVQPRRDGFRLSILTSCTVKGFEQPQQVHGRLTLVTLRASQGGPRPEEAFFEITLGLQ